MPQDIRIFEGKKEVTLKDHIFFFIFFIYFMYLFYSFTLVPKPKPRFKNHTKNKTKINLGTIILQYAIFSPLRELLIDFC